MMPGERITPITDSGGLWFFLWLLCFSLLPLPAQARQDDSDDSIHINARSVEANEKTGTAVYRGNVMLEQGNLSIRADRLEVRSRQNQTEYVVATGQPVKLRQLADGQNEEIQAEAKKVEYHVISRKVDMLGNVTLRQGADLFTGHALHYDIDAKHLSATGDDSHDGRIKAVIQPKKSSTHSTPAP
ncbi:MAG: lipopolysaccharide transport periplasmic protein LptA [Pseudomonadota bacterium]